MLFIFLILVPDADGPSPWDGEAFRTGILEMFANFRILDELADMGIVRVADVGDGFLNADLDLVGVSNRKFGWAPFYLAMTFVAMALLLGRTVTAEPLLNPGATGAITYKGDYSAVSSIITRHEKATATLDGSDQFTSVTVEGTKVSGAANVTVDLKDQTGTVLDTGTASVASASGAYSTVVTLDGGITKYNAIATVLANYTSSGAPTSLTKNIIEGYYEKDANTLSVLGLLADVQTSDDSYLLIDTTGGTPGYFVSLEFDGTVPGGATIVSVKVYIEHAEDNGFAAGELVWEVGTGTLSSPTVLGSTTPTMLKTSPNQEAVVEWDVSTIIDTVAEVNDLKVKMVNSSTNGKKSNIDHAYVVVEYTP